MAIHTYLSPGVTPAHRLGLVRNLNVNSWDPGQPEWGIPEPLRECEALIVMGGGPATHRVVHLTRLVGKPILPNHSLRRSREGGVPNRMGKIRIVLRRAGASVPRDHGFGFDDQQSRSPLTPESREPDPQEPVGGCQTHLVCTGGAVKDQELMPKGKDLGLNCSPSAKSLPN